jgi:hypothetical protein
MMSKPQVPQCYHYEVWSISQCCSTQSTYLLLFWISKFKTQKTDSYWPLHKHSAKLPPESPGLIAMAQVLIPFLALRFWLAPVQKLHESSFRKSRSHYYVTCTYFISCSQVLTAPTWKLQGKCLWKSRSHWSVTSTYSISCPHLKTRS